MKNAHRISAVLLVLAAFTTAAMADGMIVPVRPDIRVRGHWAVKYHHVRITVRDQVASVSIDQEFVNTGRGMIEVEYLFPVPPGAAIDSMTLVVDGKEFAAKLLKADEARKIYEDIVRRKKDPALLEYAGFGLYRTKAFPLLPGKPCKVIVTYKSVCKKDHDLVELWYPLNTEKFSARPIEDVEVKADLKSKADITAVYSPTHDITVRRKSPRHVIATYHAKNVLPTTDFQVFYKAANEAVGATLLTHQPEAGKDGYFMLLVSPNPRSAATAVAAKDVVIVLDRSGSMSGEKIDQAKGALGFIMRNLNKADRFEIIAYNDSVESLFDVLVPADEKHVAQATSRLDRIDAGGGTNIHEALQVAMNRVASKQADGRPKYVIFLTDGLPTVGKTDEKTILADTKKANVNRARLFAFGVGYDVNVRLLDKLVAENKGRSDYVKPKENVEAKVSSLYTKIKDPVMTGLKVRIEGLRLRDTYPRELGDLFAGDQIVMVGRYQPPARLEMGTYRTQLVITGVYEGRQRGFEYHVTVAPAGKRGGCTFVEKLWAVRRVGWLLDQIQLHGKSKELLDELVRLSMAHGIMTPYTSFLADETTRLSDSLDLHRQAEIAARPLSKVSG
ncbi:MAG: VWA domain-containing protein, partial [Planctomycetota bacterium]|nr:VWA domain-containing protein [Planctomycetota bacterium]